ncbi:hypothetical protein Hdeb2414_s0011g00372161 [Helianthus debilis subsp. tardiflorus]
MRERLKERERNRRSARLPGGLLNFPVVNDKSPAVQDLIRQVSDRVRVGFGSDLVMVRSGYGSSCGSGFGSVNESTGHSSQIQTRFGRLRSGSSRGLGSSGSDWFKFCFRIGSILALVRVSSSGQRSKLVNSVNGSVRVSGGSGSRNGSTRCN